MRASDLEFNRKCVEEYYLRKQRRENAQREAARRIDDMARLASDRNATPEAWAAGLEAARRVARQRMAECPFQRDFAAREARARTLAARTGIAATKIQATWRGKTQRMWLAKKRVEDEDWEMDFAYYHVLADLDPRLADEWSVFPQPCLSSTGHLATPSGHWFDADAEFSGEFMASSATTTVARLRVAPRGHNDDTVDVQVFDDGGGHDDDDDDDGGFDPAFPRHPFDGDHLNTNRDLGRQVARMGAGRDGWFYVELTSLASRPCYMAAHAGAPWTADLHAATRKPDVDNDDDRAYLRAARQHNLSRARGDPRVREDLVPAHYTPAPSDFNVGEALYDEDDDDAADLRRALSSLGSIYHAPAFDCLLASGGSYDAREFALLLVATRWRLFLEEKDPASFPPFAEHILDRARRSAAATIRNIRHLVAKLRTKTRAAGVSLRLNDPRRGPLRAPPMTIRMSQRRRRHRRRRTAQPTKATKATTTKKKSRRGRRGGRGRRRRKNKATTTQ